MSAEIWVCLKCESGNPDGSPVCEVCGEGRGLESGSPTSAAAVRPTEKIKGELSVTGPAAIEVPRKPPELTVGWKNARKHHLGALDRVVAAASLLTLVFSTVLWWTSQPPVTEPSPDAVDIAKESPPRFQMPQQLAFDIPPTLALHDIQRGPAPRLNPLPGGRQDYRLMSALSHDFETIRPPKSPRAMPRSKIVQPPKPSPKRPDGSTLQRGLIRRGTILRPLRQAPTLRKPYNGPNSGIVVWSGQVPKGDTVTVEDGLASVGTVTGSLPGVPVIVDLEARYFALVEAPSPLNGWKRLAIRSKIGKPVAIVIKWTVVE